MLISRRWLWTLGLCAITTVRLAAQEATTLTGVVTTSADGLPVPGAVVSVVGLNAAATTDGTGRYTLEIPRSLAPGGKAQIKVEGLGLPAKIIEVDLMPGPMSLDIALSIGFSETVTVGSRAVGAEAQKAVPVDIITQEQIASSGYAETAQVLEAIAHASNLR